MNKQFLKSFDTLTGALTPYEDQEGYRHFRSMLMDDHDSLVNLQITCHELNKTWWKDPATGEPIERNKGELLCLIHSEVSEAMEGERKNLMDDKLPHRRMAEVELADAIIRILDYAQGFGYDIAGALFEKLAYNANREDHKPEHRLTENGKKF